MYFWVPHEKQLKLFEVSLVFVLSRMCHSVTADQCPAQKPFHFKALKGFTFKTLQKTSAFGCLYHCHYEVRCQSYNFVVKDNICEMNNRTKEVKPERFVSDPDRFYMKRGAHRVSLGSIPSLPAESCAEIKANEGGDVVSGNKWLVSPSSGDATFTYCDMDAEESSSCKEIKLALPHAPSGMYPIQPESGLTILVYCDMTSFGGGWTMCYSTSNTVNPKREVTYDPIMPYGTNGYRSDCNNIQLREIIFVDETTQDKAFFTYKSNSTLVADENYGRRLPSLWLAGGTADPTFEYQLLICNTNFFSGFFISGFTNCYKTCYNWCGDTVSPYFRLASSKNKYGGVSFNVNGHSNVGNRLISVGLR